MGPTCKIPRSTQRNCSGIRLSPKMCQEHGAWKIIPFPFSCGTLWKTSQDAMLRPTSEMFISWICLRRLTSRVKDPFFANPPQGYTRVEIQPKRQSSCFTTKLDHWTTETVRSEKSPPQPRKFWCSPNLQDVNLLRSRKKLPIVWIYPPPSNSGKWRFIGISY